VSHDAYTIIHQGRIRALLLAWAAGTGMFACLALFGASSSWWAFVVGLYVYHRARRSDRILLWLRRFKERDRGRARFSRILTMACRGVVVPVTLQDSSFRTSSPAAFSRMGIFGTGLLTLLALALGYLAGEAVIAWAPRLDSQVLMFSVFPLVLLLGFRLQVKRLGYKELEAPDEATSLRGSLADIRNRGSIAGGGVLILKCADPAWRDVVIAALENADAALIDLSEPSTNLLWELQMANARLPASSILLAYRTPLGKPEPLPEDLETLVRAAVGEEKAGQMPVVYYAATQRRVGRRLGRAVESLQYAVASALRVPPGRAPARAWVLKSARSTRLIEKTFYVLLAILIALGELYLQRNSRSRPASPYEEAGARLHQRILAVPAARQALAGLSDQELGDRLKRLQARGMIRLPTSLLLARASVMSRALAVADTKTCAALVRDTATPLERRAVFSRLTPSEIDTWFTIVAEATLAEVADHPAAEPPTPAAIAGAFEALTAIQPGDFEPRMWRAMESPAAASDDELCWVFRKVWAAVDQLEEPHRSTLARAFAME
jgi:hypothetical protein